MCVEFWSECAGVKRAETLFGHCIHLEYVLNIKICGVVYWDVALL